jgi:hypothetical protein
MINNKQLVFHSSFILHTSAFVLAFILSILSILFRFCYESEAL